MLLLLRSIAAASLAIAGSIAGTSTDSGSIGRSAAVTGASAGASTQSGLIGRAAPLQGASAGTGSDAIIISRSAWIDAVSAGTSADAASVGITVPHGGYPIPPVIPVKVIATTWTPRPGARTRYRSAFPRPTPSR